MKILIVDDIKENLKLLCVFLEPYGHCDMASDGQMAVALFESGFADSAPYDLVLLEIAMLGTDGQEALKRMRQIEKENAVPSEEQTPIIMVTAVDASVEVAVVFEHGCTDLINKPISRGKLLAKLSEHGLIPSLWWKGNRQTNKEPTPNGVQTELLEERYRGQRTKRRI